MGTENGQGKFPVCHQERFTQNSDGWTVVKVTLELKLAGSYHASKIKSFVFRKGQLKSFFQA